MLPLLAGQSWEGTPAEQPCQHAQRYTSQPQECWCVAAMSLAGDKQWGVGSMQHDLSDAVAWAVSRGIADPQRVCIMGSSYGGYATFAGALGSSSST
jgi:hypothetical protein